MLDKWPRTRQEVSQVETPSRESFVPGEEGCCVCSVGRTGGPRKWWERRQAQATPGPARPHRPGEDFGVLSRAVTSQGL